MRTAASGVSWRHRPPSTQPSLAASHAEEEVLPRQLPHGAAPSGRGEVPGNKHEVVTLGEVLPAVGNAVRAEAAPMPDVHFRAETDPVTQGPVSYTHLLFKLHEAKHWNRQELEARVKVTDRRGVESIRGGSHQPVPEDIDE